MPSLRGLGLWLGGFVAGILVAALASSLSSRSGPVPIPVNEVEDDGSAEAPLRLPVERRHRTWDAYSYRQ